MSQQRLRAFTADTKILDDETLLSSIRQYRRDQLAQLLLRNRLIRGLRLALVATISAWALTGVATMLLMI